MNKIDKSPVRSVSVETCRDCPNFGHKGAFGEIAYIPVCQKTWETLPHVVVAQKGHPVAIATGEIPTSCPLPTLAQIWAS